MAGVERASSVAPVPLGSVQTVEFIAAIIGVLGLIAYLVVAGVVSRKPHGISEDAAREYFDQHGHWPDDN
jgi:hypothetical protein